MRQRQIGIFLESRVEYQVFTTEYLDDDVLSNVYRDNATEPLVMDRSSKFVFNSLLSVNAGFLEVTFC